MSVYDNLGRSIAKSKRLKMSKKELREEADRLYDEMRKVKDELEERDRTIRSIPRLKQEIKELRDIAIAKSKELNLMYLKAIGEAKTVKEVADIENRYHEYGGDLVRTSCYSTISGGSMTFHPPKWESKVHHDFFVASKTKIKRLNRDEIDKALAVLEVTDPKGDLPPSMYAGVMAELIKKVANLEIDATKAIDARDKGLNPRQVFESLLAQYGIRQFPVTGR